MMFHWSSHLTRLISKSNQVILPKRNVRIPFWEFLKTSFQARENPEASRHRKRIGGFQPIKTELFANKSYYWCSCGYAQHQAFCDQSCTHLKGDFRPLKFTSSKFQLAELCMCKLTEKAPYCDQSCRTRFAGMQMRMGNAVEGTYANVKDFLNTVPTGVDNYRKFAADRQAKLEHTERLRKKVDEAKNKKLRIDFYDSPTFQIMTDRKAKRSRVIINDGTWDCSLCTYKNPCVAFRCEMCDSRKGTATRKPKLVVNDHIEQLPRSKRKTEDDYSSDASTTDDTDAQDDEDDDDDEEFHHEERKNPQSHTNHTRRSFPTDHFNENISSPASSTTTIQSYRSASPSSSSKLNDQSKLATTKKRATFNSLSRSTKSASSLITNKKMNNHEIDQKKSLKHQSSKSKDNKQRPSNDVNQKAKTANNERNKTKNPLQQKKKKTKLSSLSSMSSSSSTSSNSSSTHTTTTITVDGVSVRITELVPTDPNSLTTNDNLSNGNNPSRASSPSPTHRTHSQLEK